MKKKNKTTIDDPKPPPPFEKLDSEPILKQMQLKILYLSTETSDLKVKNSELQSLLKINQETLKGFFQEETKNSLTGKASSNDNSVNKQRNPNNIKDNVLQNVLEGVYNENQRLYELLEKISKEKDEAKTQVFLLYL